MQELNWYWEYFGKVPNYFNSEMFDNQPEWQNGPFMRCLKDNSRMSFEVIGIIGVSNQEVNSEISGPQKQGTEPYFLLLPYSKNSRYSRFITDGVKYFFPFHIQSDVEAIYQSRLFDKEDHEKILEAITRYLDGRI